MNPLKGFLPFFPFPYFLKGILINIAVDKSFIAEIGAAPPHISACIYIRPERQCQTPLIIPFAVIPLFHRMLTENDLKIFCVELPEGFAETNMFTVAKIFIRRRMAEGVLGVGLYNKIVHAKILRNLRQKRSLVPVLRQQNHLHTYGALQIIFFFKFYRLSDIFYDPVEIIGAGSVYLCVSLPRCAVDADFYPCNGMKGLPHELRDKLHSPGRKRAIDTPTLCMQDTLSNILVQQRLAF